MNTDLNPKLIFQSVANNLQAANPSHSKLSPAMMMIQVQMLIAENYDDQLKDVADKLDFLKDVSQAYTKNINTVNTFLANPTKESHHGKKPVIITSAAQGAELLSSLTNINYNLADKSMNETGIEINDLESKHKISNELAPNGKTNTKELSQYCENLAKITDRSEYIEEAKKLGDNKDLRLLFYYSNKSNDGLDGKPVMTFYVDSIEKLLQVMESNKAKLDTEIDKLTTSITDLTEKRKSALEGANAAINKINEVTTNTMNKM